MDRITDCKIKRSTVDPTVTNVWVKHKEEDEWEVLFTFYANEISFSPDELIGLTDKEGYELRLERDREFLRS